MADLTEKQKRFAEEYAKTGNAKQSYITVYGSKNEKSAEAHSSRLVSNGKVYEYIQELNKIVTDKNIADMKEIKEFWTNVLRTEYKWYEDKEGNRCLYVADMKDRLKASEYIAKTNAAFIEKNEIEFNSIPQIIIKRGDSSGK